MDRTNQRNRIFATLTLVLRQPESLLSWAFVILLALFTVNSNEPLNSAWLTFRFAAWHWLLVGLLLQLALFYGAWRNPESLNESRTRSFRKELNPNQIRNRNSREQFLEAMMYHDNIHAMVTALDTSGAMKLSLSTTLTDIGNWMRYMHDLALKIDGFEANDLIHQDLLRIPGQLREVEDQLAAESDETLLQDIQARRERLSLQHENLLQAEQVARRAKITLQNTRDSLATIYAQMARMNTLKSIDGSRANRLREEIRDEVNQMSDVLLTMDEMRSIDDALAVESRHDG
ncbi:MAG: hypothetical protein OXG09_06635 [Chloroflexi bacterium]|nr:hypothetical protein [Chloroflexota bacterium]